MAAIQQILLSYPGFVGPLDAYTTGLGGAYSVARRLLTSYTGPLIRVRRDSDGTEADIGYDADGLLDEAALLAFVGAGSGYLVTIYDQSGLGRHVTCSTSANQIRVVNAGVVEVVGTQSRLCGYVVSTNQGPYVSDTFTANASATISAVSSFFMSASTAVSAPRYLSLTKDNNQDSWATATDIGVFARYYNLAGLATMKDGDFPVNLSVSLGALHSAYFRLTGAQMELNAGGTSATAAFSTTLGFNRVLMCGISANLANSEAGDRQLEHVIWQTDIGATAAAAIRAEQEAFYA